MGTRRQQAGVSRLGRFVRGLRPDRNPLRRGSDRAEAAVVALLAIAFLAAAPFTALAAGGWAFASAHRSQLSEEASWHQVPALVLKVSPAGQPAGGYAVALTARAQARWTAPDGTVVTGEIPVPRGTAAGTTLRLWTTDAGQPSGQPLQDSQVSGSAYLAGTCSVAALAALLAITGLLARRALDRRRMAAWDAEWRAAGPRWTTPA